MKTNKTYHKPKAEIIRFKVSNIVCDSAMNQGGSRDMGGDSDFHIIPEDDDSGSWGLRSFLEDTDTQDTE